MKLESPAFPNEGPIPAEYTCEGRNVSPPLRWSDIPSDAKSLVLIVDDPDAPDPARPQRPWTHWLLYNIPPTTTALDAGVRLLPPSALEGVNDWHRIGYGGPCPPVGRHRYFFKLFALDTSLRDLNEPDKAFLLHAMQPHVIAEAQWIGTYEKTGTRSARVGGEPR